jgi:carboxymethylenebutenolidase
MSGTHTTHFVAKNGTDASGELREPKGTGKAPGLVLIQEYWGVNDHVRSLADRLATSGFLVLAPDLYHGKVTKDASVAAKLMTELDRDQAVNDLAGAVRFLKEHARCTGKIGVIGFCMGGAFSFTSAALIPGVNAAVPFYGIPDATKVDLSSIAVPIQAHFSKSDTWAKPEAAVAVKKALDAKGVPMELHLYDASHAFMNDTRPEVYSPDNAKAAWERAVAFLQKHLA